MCKELKICIGCGWRSDRKIDKKFKTCCPESNYVPLDYYLENSIFKRFKNANKL